MKYIISFLLLVIFWLNETAAQNAKLYGYVQKSTPGTAAARDIDENGNTNKTDKSSSESYHLYFSTSSKNRLYPIEGWIKGERVGIKAEVVTTPATFVTDQGETATMVPKTNNKVYLLTGTELIGAKQFAKAATMAKTNKFVFVYRLNGKTNYAVLKKLQSLPTTHLE